MPEGPEVWREAQAIANVIEGERVIRATFAWPAIAPHANVITNATVTQVRPRGKAIAFSTGDALVTHNQLYGQWRVAKTAPTMHKKALRIQLETARGAAMLYSATDIDWLAIDRIKAHPYIAKLGPDAMDPATSVETVRARLIDPRFRQRSLAALLLDQGFIAGLGNYLRSDILFFARVREHMKPAQCSADEIDALANSIVAMPRQSFHTRGVTNDVSLERDLKRHGWRFSRRRHWVFDREGEACHICASTIERAVVSGRNVFFCATCQRG
jgi:endonuclease VIII